MKRVILFFGLLLFSGLSSFGQAPVDKNATPETVALFNFLYHLNNNQIVFGHQDELLVGGNHPRGTGGSDTYDMIGDYPGLFGFDLSYLEQGKFKNKSNLSFENIKNKIQYIYSKGGIITLMWSVNNPVDPTQGSRDKGNDKTIEELFSDNDNLARYNNWLDKLALFFKSLKASDGHTLIPVLFRPFHECNGSWFWWGKGRATPQDYIRLYQYTVNYLLQKNVHNLLYVYSPDAFKSASKYLSRYPGNDYVDVLGLDCYDKVKYQPGAFQNGLRQMCTTINDLAKDRNKICALTETGFKNMPVANWWTNSLYSAINGTGVSYVMIWSNFGKKKNAYWGAFKGQISADNFVNFSKNKNILFLSDLSVKKVYGD